jgi:diadenylate cyclase
VAAAACFLPLTMNPVMLRRLGTRHRAAIGITEESDAIAVVVSEETGQIAVAARGDLESDVPLDRVRELLTRHGSGRPRRTEAAPEPRWQAEP